MSYEQEVHLASKPNANTALQDPEKWTHIVIVKGRYGNVQVYKNGERYLGLPEAWTIEFWIPPVKKKKWWQFWKGKTR